MDKLTSNKINLLISLLSKQRENITRLSKAIDNMSKLRTVPNFNLYSCSFLNMNFYLEQTILN